MIEEVTRPAVAGPVIVAVIYLLYLCFLKQPRVPAELPWIGRKPGLFADFRASLRGTLSNLKIFEEGYNKYSKNGQYFVMPNLITGPMVVLPHTDAHWLNDQPESVLDASGPQADMLSSDYTLNIPVLINHDHLKVIRRDLTRNLGALAGDITDEIDCAFKDSWGVDTENWKTVNTYNTIMDIVARTANRIFVGKPLCQDKVFTDRCERLAQSIAGSGIMLRVFPRILKPIFAPIAVLPIQWYTRKCNQSLFPVIRERLEELKHRTNNPDSKESPEPKDLLQWLINLAASRPDGALDLQEDRIACRVMTTVFTAIHTSTLTGNGTLLDLAASAPENQYIEGLREECTRILAEDNGVWTKEGLGKMYRVDSAIRESQRINGLGTGGMTRRVVASNGIQLPDGSHAPKGTLLTVGTWSVQHDSDLYTDPHTYDPLRYSSLREEFMQQEKTNGATQEKIDSSDILKHKNLSMVSTSDRHLAFGFGKHACPGRFFAANEIKILFAYMVMNYEIEHLPQRPPNFWFGDFTFPPMDTEIRIKRRKLVAI